MVGMVYMKQKSIRPLADPKGGRFALEVHEQSLTRLPSKYGLCLAENCFRTRISRRPGVRLFFLVDTCFQGIWWYRVFRLNFVLPGFS